MGESMAMLVPENPGAMSSDTLFRLSVAGAESNVAAYLSMLGTDVSWISKVGDDSFGRFLLDEIRSFGVDVGHAARDPEHPTGVAFKDRSEEQTRVWYYRSGSAASTMGPEAARLVGSLGARVIHISGITSALSASCRDFLAELIRTRATGTAVSFDVNWRPALWKDDGGPAAMLDVARAADIVFVGLDEANDLWGSTHPMEVRRLLPDPEYLVVKQGAEGCTVFHRDEQVFVPALVVDVVEPVGAGDAFAAGFLSGYLRGMTIRDAGRLGTITASCSLSVVTDIGALPGREYISELLQLTDEGWRGQRFAPNLKESSNTRVPNR
ncbi:sugar kinase [Arthrobacter sp. RT-1]|nr:sugar kinase [Arthrobacter sp. RT-1]